MVLVYLDRAMELSRTEGSGAYDLDGAVIGYQAFTDVGDGNTCYYAATDGRSWEVGLGTYVLASSRLIRTTILDGSNDTSPVNWLAGSKNVWIDSPASAIAGFVTGITVATENGFAGSSSGGVTPVLTLSTTETGMLSGNGTALVARTITGTSGRIGVTNGDGSGNPTIDLAAAVDVRDYLDTAPYVADRTALAAIDTSKDTVAYLKESGRQGVFQWDSSNLSTQVTADAQQGVYVAPASAPTGASGAWVRQFSGPVNVSWFNSGSSVLTTGLLAALTLWKTVYIPEGAYTSGAVAFPDDGVVYMHPKAVVTPVAAFASDMWVLGNRGGVIGGQFDASFASFPLVNVIRAISKDRVLVRDVRMPNGARTGILLQACTNSLVDNCTVSNNGDAPGIYLVTAGSTGNTVRNCQSHNSGSHGIQFSDGIGNICEGCYSFGSFAFGISFAGGETGSKCIGNTTQKSKAEGINFDNTTGCIMDGNSTLWSASGGYASTDFGICLNGDSAACDRNVISNNYVDGCAKSGIAVAGTTSGKYNVIEGNTITNVNSLNESHAAGVLLYAANATGNIVGNNVCRGDGTNMKYGVNTTFSNTSGNTINENAITNVATATMLLTPLDIVQRQEISYTPTLTPAGGSLTSASATARGVWRGKRIKLDVRVVVTTVGTATGALAISLPSGLTSGASTYAAVYGRETQSTGVALTGDLQPSSSSFSSIRYDNATWLASGRTALLSVEYELA